MAKRMSKAEILKANEEWYEKAKEVVQSRLMVVPAAEYKDWVADRWMYTEGEKYRVGKVYLYCSNTNQGHYGLLYEMRFVMRGNYMNVNNVVQGVCQPIFGDDGYYMSKDELRTVYGKLIESGIIADGYKEGE